MSTQRKLTAILSADVVGYTRLMGRDEQATLESLKESRRIFAEHVAECDGRVNDTAGDSILAEFPSAVRAVECAIAIQGALRQRNGQLPEDRQMRYRIGINVGDVIADGDTIYGDGVNVAARTQELADPGGISICGPAYEQVRDKLDLNVESLGRQRFKNVAEPIVCYRIADKPGAAPTPPTRRYRLLGTLAAVGVAAIAAGALLFQTERGEEPAPVESAMDTRPSVAVLPFTNLSADPAQTYFSDGITSDIITDLSRLKALRVIARQSTFTYKDTSLGIPEIAKALGVRYVVGGSVQKAGQRLRINVHVTDAPSNSELWGERYDGSVDDLFAVQDEVTRRIVDVLAVQLTSEEQRNLGRAQAHSFEAYDLFLQGQEQYRVRTREGNEHAKEAYKRAIALDPEFARAYGALAAALAYEYWRGWTDAPNEAIEHALELAQRAVTLDDQSPQAYWALGYVHLRRKEYQEATEAAERAVKLAPNYADGYGLMALVDVFTGQYEQAVALIRKAMDLNPYYTYEYPNLLGRAYYGLGRYSQAAQAFEKALQKNANTVAPRLYLASSYLRMGRADDAEWEIEQAQMAEPGITLSQVANTLPLQDRAELNRLLDDLRQAGLPE
jgi:adenylate cyclase